jgi:hypothetical protein
MHLHFGSERQILKGLLLFLHDRYGQPGVEIERLRTLLPPFLERLGNTHAQAFLGEIRLEEGEKVLDEIIQITVSEEFVKMRGSFLCPAFARAGTHEVLQTMLSMSELEGLEVAAAAFFEDYKHSFPTAA